MAGRPDSAMDDNVYSQVNASTFETACDSNIAQGDQKDNKPVYTIEGVLFFIQAEWTRLEMQRYQWEVERAELQARMAFLQGEIRGQQQLKQDLVRRIEMLEYSLKQERAKFHMYKSLVRDGNLSKNTELKNGNQDQSNMQISENPKQNSLDPGQKLEECTERALESNSKWRESRLRLKQFLQEVGYTDAMLNVREARIRQLLMPSNSDLNVSDCNIKKIKFLDEKPRLNKFDSKNGKKMEKNNNQVDAQTLAALDEMDDAVQKAQDMLDSSSSETYNYEPDELFTDKDFSGNAGGTDNHSDPAWVNRYRITGRTVKRNLNGQNKYDESNSNPVISSFLNSFSESGSHGQMKRFTGKHADTTILDLINNLSDKVDEDPENGSLFDSSNEMASSIHSMSITSTSVTSSGATGGSNLTCRRNEHVDNPIDDLATGTKDPNSEEGLVLGDLAIFTVTNYVDNEISKSSFIYMY